MRYKFFEQRKAASTTKDRCVLNYFFWREGSKSAAIYAKDFMYNQMFLVRHEGKGENYRFKITNKADLEALVAQLDQWDQELGIPRDPDLLPRRCIIQ